MTLRRQPPKLSNMYVWVSSNSQKSQRSMGLFFRRRGFRVSAFGAESYRALELDDSPRVRLMLYSTSIIFSRRPLALTLTPALTRAVTASFQPSSAALSRSRSPHISKRKGSIVSIRSLNTPSFLPLIALSRAGVPMLFVAAQSAPFSTNARATLSSPCNAAKLSGVYP